MCWNKDQKINVLWTLWTCGKRQNSQFKKASTCFFRFSLTLHNSPRHSITHAQFLAASRAACDSQLEWCGTSNTSKIKREAFGTMLYDCMSFIFICHFYMFAEVKTFWGPKRMCIASFNKVHCPKVPVWSQPHQRAVQPRVLLRHPPQRWCRWVAIAPWRYGRPWRRWMGWETSRAETTWLKGMGREWAANGRRLHEAEIMFPLEIAPARFATYPKIDGCPKWRDDMIKQEMRKDEKLQTTKNYFYDHDGCQHLASRQVVTTPSAPAPPAPLLARRQISMTSGRPKYGTFCLHEPHMLHVLLSYETL